MSKGDTDRTHDTQSFRDRYERIDWGSGAFTGPSGGETNGSARSSVALYPCPHCGEDRGTLTEAMLHRCNSLSP